MVDPISGVDYDNRKVTVTRNLMREDGTFGMLETDTHWLCLTMERVWLNNAPDISCIPIGIYPVKWILSPRHGKFVYQIQNVDHRSGIEFDIANLMSQLLGCVALGKERLLFDAGACGVNLPPIPMMGLTNSIETMAAFEKEMRDKSGNQQNFTVEIR